MKGKIRLSKSQRKFIRKEKARIKREILSLEEQKKLIDQLYERFLKQKVNKRKKEAKVKKTKKEVSQVKPTTKISQRKQPKKKSQKEALSKV